MSLKALLDDASRHFGLIRVEDARHHGVSRVQLERLDSRGVLELIGENVFRVAGAPRSWNQGVLAGCWRIGPQCVASMRAATALYELSGSRRRLIEFMVPRGAGARPARLRVHETRHQRGADISVIDGIPVTSPERTIIDMASLGPVERTERLLDDAVHKGLTTSRRVADHLGAMPTRGRRGARNLWDLLAERTGDLDERANAWENLMARLIHNSDLPRPVRQLKVAIDDCTYYLDFAFPEHRVAIECDSAEWHSTGQQIRHDLDRQHHCETVGWAFKRFVKSQARQDPAGTVAKIRDLMIDRGWIPPN